MDRQAVGILVAAIFVLWWLWPRKPRDLSCPKCGGETEWYEGMGAGFWRCDKCNCLAHH